MQPKIALDGCHDGTKGIKMLDYNTPLYIWVKACVTPEMHGVWIMQLSHVINWAFQCLVNSQRVDVDGPIE